MPLREYICDVSKCNQHNHKKELLVGMNEVPNCDFCGLPLKQIHTEGPAGFVKGSSTPCSKKY